MSWNEVSRVMDGVNQAVEYNTTSLLQIEAQWSLVRKPKKHKSAADFKYFTLKETDGQTVRQTIDQAEGQAVRQLDVKMQQKFNQQIPRLSSTQSVPTCSVSKIHDSRLNNLQLSNNQPQPTYTNPPSVTSLAALANLSLSGATKAPISSLTSSLQKLASQSLSQIRPNLTNLKTAQATMLPGALPLSSVGSTAKKFNLNGPTADTPTSHRLTSHRLTSDPADAHSIQLLQSVAKKPQISLKSTLDSPASSSHTRSSFASLLLQKPKTTVTQSKHTYTTCFNIDDHIDTQFKFDVPSPDDIVLNARANADKLKKNVAEKKAIKTNSSLSLKGAKSNVIRIESKPSIQSSASSSLDTQSAHHLMMSRNIGKFEKLDVAASCKSISSSGLVLEPPAISKTSSTGSLKKTVKINVLDEYSKKQQSTKSAMNLVVVGHVDAGKSTIMGHLLYLLGQVNERTIRKYEKEAESLKKGSFAYAWVLDETDEERTRGITMDIAMRNFETEHHKLTLLDAPGHKDFIPNMISGASQADVAMLVVDSGTGEFESGFDLGGQTREHALLLRSLGVAQVVVAINKLDSVDWSESRFNEIKHILSTYLTQQAGFKADKITFIPCSGFTGENLTKRTEPKLCQWYSGLTLQESIDQLDAPARQLDKPFRLSVADYFKGGLSSGTGANVTVCGRIEAGTLQLGESVLVTPINEVATVKAIESNEETSKWAVSGDNVIVSLTGIELQQINIGSVLCDPEYPIPVTKHFMAQIITFDLNIPLTIGVPVVVHLQSLNESGYISKLISILDKSTGQILKKNPRALTKNMTAIVEIKSKVLGRFTLRSGSETVAAGIGTLKKDKSYYSF